MPAHYICEEKPSHGKLFVSEHDDQRYSLEELGDIKTWLNGLLKNYAATLERVYDYATTGASKASNEEISLAALEFVECLKETSERAVDDEQKSEIVQSSHTRLQMVYWKETQQQPLSYKISQGSSPQC